MMDNTYNFEESLGFWAYRLHFQIVVLVKRSFLAAGYDVTPEQWGLLARLNGCEGITQIRLGEIASKDRHNITRILNQLQKKGYIERREDIQDKRVYRLYLTDSGRKVHDALMKIVRSHFDKVYADLDVDEVNKARLLLQSVTANVEKILHEF